MSKSYEIEFNIPESVCQIINNINDKEIEIVFKPKSIIQELGCKEELKSVSKVTYRKKVEHVINLTIGEYFVSSSIKNRENKMRKLFKKLSTDTSIINQSINTSRWEKEDNIKVVSNKNKQLCKYIAENYSAVWLHNIKC